MGGGAESENLKGGGSMVQGQVFLNGGGGELTLFLFHFFQGLSFLPFEITLPFEKLCYAFEKKKNSVTIIL